MSRLKEDIESTHHFRRHDIDQPKAHYNQAVEGGAFVPETSVIGDGISQCELPFLFIRNATHIIL